MTRRVVISGMGMVSPLGCGVQLAWSRLLAGQSGISNLPEGLVAHLPSKVGGIVPSELSDPEGGFQSSLSLKEQRRTDRFIQFAIAAADEAIMQSGWRPSRRTERERTATIIASGFGGISSATRAVRTIDAEGMPKLSPYIVPSLLINMAAAHVSIRYGFEGLIGAPATACVASLQAVGDGVRLIQMDEADVVVCGGAEAPIDRVSLSGFAAARVLSSRFNEEPTRSSRPFDMSRDGFVMGEGAGIVVIEALDHAIARGAQIIAEVPGYGFTSDAHHITSGHETGRGAARAMHLALQRARVDTKDVQLLNAHATSTIVGDRSELAAIKSVFKKDGEIAVTSTKSSTGHLLGAAGVVGLIFSAQAIRHQTAPPTLNLEQADPAAGGVDLVRIVKRPMMIEHVLTNGFGFGGVNASILLRFWP